MLKLRVVFESGRFWDYEANAAEVGASGALVLNQVIVGDVKTDITTGRPVQEVSKRLVAILPGPTAHRSPEWNWQTVESIEDESTNGVPGFAGQEVTQ